MSLRYSIYKVQTHSRVRISSRSNFYILAHLVEFVKNFFQVFSNSFCARYAPGEAVHHVTYLSYHTNFYLSRTFSCFSKFSDILLPSAGRLAYTSTPTPDCQALIYKFCYSFLVFLTEVNLSFRGGLYVFSAPFLSVRTIIPIFSQR